jgi:hypothetical protein
MAETFLYPQPIVLGAAPPSVEGSKVIPIAVSWAAVLTTNNGNFTNNLTLIQPINLLQQFQTGQFTTVQAVYVDNQTNASMVALTCLETGFTIRIPPFAKGMYPLLCGPSPTFTLTFYAQVDPDYGWVQTNATTRLYFLNTEQNYFESLPGNFGQNFSTYFGLFLFPQTTGGGLQMQPMIGQAGQVGMVSTGIGTQFIAINSIDVVVTLLAASLAIGPIGFGICEQGDGGYSFTRWISRTYVTAVNEVGVIYTRQVVFPSPILQIDPYNSWYVFLNTNSGLTPLNAIEYRVNITYTNVTIA